MVEGRHEGVGSVRVGEVPMYANDVDPKVYRRRLFDWIRFQDLADRSSSKYLSLGQRVFAITSNIHGSAGQRLAHVTSMVHSDLTTNEYVAIVDEILDVIDPIDRESSFLETANAWKNLMNKYHKPHQAYDKYWSEFSTLAVKYANSHGKVATASAVQELIALLCVLNANLNRTEFGMVLQSAMRCDMESSSGRMNSYRINHGCLSSAGPMSARQVLSQVSHRKGPVVEDNSGVAEGADDQVQSTNDDGSMRDLVAALTVELADMETRNTAMSVKLADVLSTLGEEAEVQALVTDLKEVRVTVETSELCRKSCVNVVQQISTTKVTQPANPVRISKEEPHDVTPIITMESVRVALRRLDYGDKALSKYGDVSRSQLGGSPPYSEGGREALPDQAENLTRTQLANEMKGRCWICYGDHLAFQNTPCREKLMKMKVMQGSKPTTVDGDLNDGDAKGRSSVSKVSWGEEDRTTRTGITMMTKASLMVCIEDCDIIVDGGATSTVIGWRIYIEVCYRLNINPLIHNREKNDPKYHAFGTKENSSELQEIVGRCYIPVPIGKGRWLGVRALVVDGDVPFIMGKDALVSHGAVEDHKRNRITFRTIFGPATLNTSISHEDGHARIALGGLSAAANVAESMLVDMRSPKSDKDRDGRDLVQRIHARTHIHPDTCEMLLKRAGRWSKSANDELKRTVQSCHVCQKSGEPQKMNKFSLSKLNREFNDVVEIDIMYWGKKMMLHAVDTATGYSEIVMVSSRKLTTLLSVLDKMWCLRHGSPTKFKGDQEFNKKPLKDWMKHRGCQFVPVPSRRHNKSGVVERKNRVVKDALEKLDIDPLHARLHFSHKLSLAVFTSNILYGGKMLSSFEQVRGFTPSLQGSDKKGVPQSVLTAHKEMEARRLLSRMLKSKSTKPYLTDFVVGQRVLVLIPGGKRPRGVWSEETITEAGEKHSIVVGNGRRRKVIAREDVRTLPTSDLGKTTVRAEHGIIRKVLKKTHRKTNVERVGCSEDDPSEPSYGDENVEQASEDESTVREARTSVDENAVTEGSRSASVSLADEKAVTGGNYARIPEEEVSSEVDEQIRDDGQSGERSASDDEEGKNEKLQDDVPRTRYGRQIVEPDRYTGISKSMLDMVESEEKYLKLAYDQFKGGQFYARQAPFIPKWILEKADREELSKNWSSNMVEVDLNDVPKDANVIGSHFVYKIKVDHDTIDGKEVRRLKLKSRLCVHGNKDSERESMRTDAAVVSHMGFRVVYSVSCTFVMVIGQGDVRGAYTQSGEAKRKVFVRPPFKIGGTLKYWLLKITSYGIVSAGRKWQRKSDYIVKDVLDMDIVLGMPQLFVRPSVFPGPRALLAKYVDDLLCSAKTTNLLGKMRSGVESVVELGAWKEWPDVLDVNSTEVVQTPTGVTVTAKRLKKEVELVVISPSRRKDISAEVTEAETRSVRSMAGKLGYIGVAISPLAAFAASYVQQILPKMTIAGLKHANGVVRDVLRRDCSLEYVMPTAMELRNARIAVFSDAGYPHTGVEKKVAQEGCIVGVAFGTQKGAPYHVLGWLSRKQRRVSNSSIQAECIAAVTSVGYGTHAAKVWANVTGKVIPITIVVDSLGLHRTLSTQATPTDMGSAHDIHALRVDYESGVIDSVSWIAGKKNPADPLTKPHAGETAGILTEMLVSGRLPSDINVLRCYGKALDEED